MIERKLSVFDVLIQRMLHYVQAGLLSDCPLRFAAPPLQGGAIYAQGSNHIDLTSCSFGKNSATLKGGAVALIHASAALISCSLVENFARRGAAVWLSGNATAVLTSCLISSNNADWSAEKVPVNMSVCLQWDANCWHSGAFCKEDDYFPSCFRLARLVGVL